MEKGLSRRSFLKGSAKVALGAGMLASIPGILDSATVKADEAPKMAIEWSDAADIVIVGGGGAGFTAAIEAARAGSTSLILEKCAYCGGDTLRSGGMIMVGGSEFQASLGYDDSPERFARTELGYIGEYANKEMVEEMCLNSLESLRFMQEMGREYTHLSPMNPVWAYDKEEDWAPRTHWTGIETKTGHFGTLQEEAAKYDAIRVRTGVEAEHLITNDAGEVIGVKDANGVCYRANKAVLLATASFGHNKEMSKRYNFMNYWALCHEETFNNPSPNGQHTL
ncbi:MAG: FAD-dependent oxidoreductase, partial [Clostridia bacterium]|nr:FAD-dependent oxidoreductase [Clostridia bacterium]